mmetsp:Transcript_5706/g.9057  ORF Transcript_5706/g.9057 Transcript_5706/m.9057 type:complete len:158 (-) Transcript_5706:978-1451(-)
MKTNTLLLANALVALVGAFNVELYSLSQTIGDGQSTQRYAQYEFDIAKVQQQLASWSNKTYSVKNSSEVSANTTRAQVDLSDVNQTDALIVYSLHDQFELQETSCMNKKNKTTQAFGYLVDRDDEGQDCIDSFGDPEFNVTFSKEDEAQTVVTGFTI